MQVRRLRLMIVGLVGLCILAGVALLVIVLNESGQGPVYRGKHVGVWFREYAFSSNATVTPVSARVQPDGRMVVTQISGGNRVRIVVSTNNPLLPTWLNLQASPGLPQTGDPAWHALQAMGSNAVPYLVSQLRGIPFEPTYKRAFTNLPVVLQKKLPNPMERHYLRVRALDALSGIGDPSGMATPVLLGLLRKRDPFLQFALYSAVRQLGVDRRLISQVMLEFGDKGRPDVVLEIAEKLEWEGEGIAKLLGTILKSPDVKMRRRAIVLLERSGNQAAPALDELLAALTDSDSEVRYMSARALERMGASSPEVVTALRNSLNDSNIMVQNVARRMLSKAASETVPLEASP